MKRFALSLALALFSLIVAAQTLHAEDGFRPLFNGKDLTGWEGNPELWSVEEGAITGKTNGPEHLAYNQFLIWRGGTLKNFELRVTARVTGNNTGLQYRSKELTDVGPWSIGGYQCDIHPAAPNNAMLYDERGRGIVAQNGQTVVADPQGVRYLTAERKPVEADTAAWNEYTVIAQGSHLTHKLNGQVTAEIFDFDAKEQDLAGLLAIQVHRGPAMRVQVKEVLLKDLPDTAVAAFDASMIPADAKKIGKPAPKKAQPGKAGAGKKAPAPKKGAPEAKPEVGKAQGVKDPDAKPKAGGSKGVKDPARPADKKPAKKPRPTTVGPAVKANKATPIDKIAAAKGFKVELLYSVPGVEQGSWVNLCTDGKGRILVSDQYGGLYRFAPPAPGKPLDPSTVQKVPADIRAVNGMVWAFDALYVGVNDYERKIPSGFYRISDSDGDDMLDKVELLREMDAHGDHGVHAVLLAPDKKSFYLITGNNTKPTERAPTSPVPAIWGEDHILTRMPDGRGHNVGVWAPGGIIYRISLDGKQFEAVASGFRNIFDAAFDRDGELFTYDADMEYDYNTSWYRPTRVNHVVSGAEFGWRNGAGKRPEFYPDNLPATLNIGPGSPTGVTMGYGAKFPHKYQNALYVLDWSWGKLYAVHLQPQGASYTATKEEFITGAPLPITDAIVHPQDGAMYFTIGGRRVQSGVYRVTYTGTEDTSPAPYVPNNSELRTLRHRLEAFHGKQDSTAVDTAWPYLGHTDRFIRWAARTAVEHQPMATWSERALTEKDPAIQLEALMALARVGGICPTHRRPTDPPVDTALRDKILAALTAIDFAKLNHEQQLTHVRTAEIVLNRFGKPDDAGVAKLLAQLDPQFPAKSFELNWELCETLGFLQSPTVAAKALALMAAASTQEEQIEYARSIRFVKAGWTPELHKQYFEWFLKAGSFTGGSSFEKFLEFIRNDAVASLTDAERTGMAELLARKPVKKPVLENLAEVFKGRPSKTWTLEELSALTQTELKHRDFENGRKMFAAVGCFACHRFANEGGMTGPDLSAAGRRYSPHDLLDQILNPSKEINEQFSTIVVVTDYGKEYTGIVVNLSGDSLTLNTDLTDPNQRVGIDRKEIESIEKSKVSAMPTTLLNLLKRDEIMDLVAYVISGGDPKHELFKK
ncbi:MAG: heme-binding protein [Pirellula sp.]|nr:heme-binding protein [Pirellula sp.]